MPRETPDEAVKRVLAQHGVSARIVRPWSAVNDPAPGEKGQLRHRAADEEPVGGEAARGGGNLVHQDAVGPRGKPGSGAHVHTGEPEAELDLQRGAHVAKPLLERVHAGRSVGPSRGELERER